MNPKSKLPKEESKSKCTNENKEMIRLQEILTAKEESYKCESEQGCIQII